MERCILNRTLRAAITIVAIVTAIVVIRISTQPDVYSADSPFRQVMGTFARATAVSNSEKTAQLCVDAAFAELTGVDDMMSDYKADSQLSQVNKNAFDEPVKVSGALMKVLLAAIDYSKQTGGAFDITVGPVVDLWRQAEKDGQKPTDEQLAAAKAKVGYENLILDSQSLTVRFRVEGMRLDLGGIAKGYAIDRAAEAMRANGALGGMIDVGGDIQCFGITPEPKTRENWVIGLQDPDSDAKLLVKLKLTDTAVATSGDYRRFVLIGDDRFSHIINPQTSIAAGRLSSVTIIAPTAMQADALATAVSVMGHEKGMELIESLPNAEAILIRTEATDELLTTSRARRYIQR